MKEGLTGGVGGEGKGLSSSGSSHQVVGDEVAGDDGSYDGVVEEDVGDGGGVEAGGNTGDRGEGSLYGNKVYFSARARRFARKDDDEPAKERKG